mmetsp:Transcript_153974/g.271888  ORF Transcript_153974/g.271888 Transcript_153974/m.271888 type:complete len:214 (-) Transcript_153974:200-841(-)
MAGVVHIHLMSGQQLLSVALETTQTVLQLKELTRPKLVSPLCEVCDLLIDGVAARDHQTVRDMNLVDGDILHAVVTEWIKPGMYQCSHYDDYDGGSPKFDVTTSYVLFIFKDGDFVLGRELSGDIKKCFGQDIQLQDFTVNGHITNEKKFVLASQPMDDDEDPLGLHFDGHVESIMLEASLARVAQSNLRKAMAMTFDEIATRNLQEHEGITV